MFDDMYILRRNTDIGHSDGQTDIFAVTISRFTCVACWRAIITLRAGPTFSFL